VIPKRYRSTREMVFFDGGPIGGQFVLLDKTVDVLYWAINETVYAVYRRTYVSAEECGCGRASGSLHFQFCGNEGKTSHDATMVVR
jgi:hypothetical protein